MYPLPGHVSTSYLLARYMRLNVGICVAAGLFPDLFDKAMKYVFHVFPYGRVIMHSLLGMLVTSMIMFLLKGKRWGVSWFVGHLGHLLADFFGDLFTPGPPFVPWLFPLKTYIWPEGKMFFSVVLLLIESTLMVCAFIIFYFQRKNSLKARKTTLVQLGIPEEKVLLGHRKPGGGRGRGQ